MNTKFNKVPAGRIPVKSPKGKPCPWPGKPHKDIPEDKPVFLPDDRITRKLIMDGSLKVANVNIIPIRKAEPEDDNGKAGKIQKK